MRRADGRIIGYSDEFEMCTFDTADAASETSHQRARWFGPDQQESAPATLQEIEAAGLLPYVVGTKADMKVGTPVEPI